MTLFSVVERLNWGRLSLDNSILPSRMQRTPLARTLLNRYTYGSDPQSNILYESWLHGLVRSANPYLTKEAAWSDHCKGRVALLWILPEQESARLQSFRTVTDNQATRTLDKGDSPTF
jgi:hypothetical protein